MSIEAMKQALEALELVLETDTKPKHEISKSITSLRQAIEQAEKQEPVPWQGCDLDGMVEAFDRVIEAHFFRKNPFHNPIDADAQMALRILRGFIPYMKQYTTPQPQREWVGLTDAEIEEFDYDFRDLVMDIEKLLMERNS
jgi:hypothetical protein